MLRSLCFRTLLVVLVLPLSYCSSCSDGYGAYNDPNSGYCYSSCCTCDNGYYSNSATSHDCYGCPSGTTAPTGSAYCTCAAGNYFVSSSSCVACADGTSNAASTNTNMDTYCEPCPAGTYSSSNTNYMCNTCPGSTTSNSGSNYCTCPAGKHLTGGSCVDCADGTTSSSSSYYSSSSTSPCFACTSAGYVSNSGNGHICTACSQGTYSTTSNMGICTTCPTGTSNTGTANTYCTCPEGSYFYPAGADYICISCPDGTTATASTTTSKILACWNCATGTYSTTLTGHKCVACGINTYNDADVGQGVCAACPTGTAPTVSSGATYCVCPQGSRFLTGTCLACPEGMSAAASRTDNRMTICTACALGTESKASNSHVCTPCAAGFYSDAITSQAACILCPTGSVANSATGSTYCTCAVGYYFTPTACIPCPAGSESVSSTTTNPVTVCSACTPGFQANSGTGYVCTLCPTGTYNTATTGQTTCLSCPTGSTATAGRTDCVCLAGYYFDQSNMANIICTNCPNGKETSADSTATDPTTGCTSCNPGWTSNSGTGYRCQKCVQGTYNTATLGVATCQTCPTGTTNSGTGMTYCTCAAGKYFASGVCVDCPDGSTSTESTTLSPLATCTACSQGYKSNAATTHLCVLCNANNYYSDPATGQGDCYACPTGSTSTGSVAHTYCTCAVGHYFLQISTVWSCAACPDGFSSVESSTSSKVIACTACSVGHQSNAANHHVCTLCPVGTYSDTHTGQAACYTCPGASTNSAVGSSVCICGAGYYFDGTNVCVACPNGESSVSSTTDNKVIACTPCDVGYKSNSDSDSNHLCVPCAVGMYNDAMTTQQDCYACPGYSTNTATGSTFCTCSAGYYFTSTSLTGTCQPCPDGKTSTESTTDDRETTCAPCSVGYESNAGTNHLCVACTTANTFSDSLTGQGDCYACPGQSSNSAGGTYCTCAAGYHFASLAALASCDPCPDGRCSAASTTTSRVTTCFGCDPGYQSNAGTSHLCAPCGPGYYNTLLLGQTACYACPSGSTSSDYGNTYCNCAAGRYFDGSGNCVVCPNGASSPASTTDSPVTICTACSLGYYSSATSGHICTACPAGTYTNTITGLAACVPCPNYKSNVGTANTACNYPVCDAGSYILSGATCVLCPANTYQNLDQQITCSACAAHSTSSAGAKSCTCDPQYYFESTSSTCQGKSRAQDNLVACHPYCATCTGMSTNCGACVQGNAGIVYNVAARSCTCRLTEGYMEIFPSGVATCQPCGTCPYSYLTLVRLYDYWTKIDITFTYAISFPADVLNNSPELCEYFFEGPLTTLLGAGYLCTLSGPTLTVSLGSEAAFVSTSTLPMKEGKLKVPPCTCGYDTPIAVTATVPFSLSATLVPIVSPHTACEDLSVSLGNFVGLGNRPSTLSVAYSVTSAMTTDATKPRIDGFSKSKALLNAYLSDKTTTSIRVPASLFLDSAQYTLAYTVRNFGSSFSSSVTFTTTAYTTPSLSISGATAGTKTAYEWESVRLTPVLTYPACSGSAENAMVGYVYSWGQSATGAPDVFNSTELQLSYASDDGILYFGEYTFLPERTYVFTVTVAHVYYAVSLTASVTVHIVRSEVSVRRMKSG